MLFDEEELLLFVCLLIGIPTAEEARRETTARADVYILASLKKRAWRTRNQIQLRWKTTQEPRGATRQPNRIESEEEKAADTVRFCTTRDRLYTLTV